MPLMYFGQRYSIPVYLQLCEMVSLFANKTCPNPCVHNAFARAILFVDVIRHISMINASSITNFAVGGLFVDKHAEMLDAR